MRIADILWKTLYFMMRIEAYILQEGLWLRIIWSYLHFRKIILSDFQIEARLQEVNKECITEGPSFQVFAGAVQGLRQTSSAKK